MTNPPPQDVRPEDRDRLHQEMTHMRAAADDVIRTAPNAPGTDEDRYQAGVMSIFAVMRPRFGPANAALFGARDEKLASLAQALGRPSDQSIRDLDPFFDVVEQAVAKLRALGLTVGSGLTWTSAVLWQPRRPGWKLEVVDGNRQIPWSPPYAELSSAPGGPTSLAPKITVHLFPPERMATQQSMMSREQSGTLEGALADAWVFSLQAAQSGDVDDGKTWEKVREALFRELPPVEGVRHGVLSIPGAPPERIPAPPPGVNARLWQQRDGGDLTIVATP